MESLRNFLTGPRLIFVVLVCAVPFVFLGTGSLQTAFTGSFGSINGEDVTENDIQIAANSAVSRFKSIYGCLLYTSPSPRDLVISRMPSSA